MQAKVVVRTHGHIHYSATCDECEWGACIFTGQTPTESSVCGAARRHVMKTGHTVTIESAKSRQYEASKC